MCQAQGGNAVSVLSSILRCAVRRVVRLPPMLPVEPVNRYPAFGVIS